MVQQFFLTIGSILGSMLSLPFIAAIYIFWEVYFQKKWRPVLWLMALLGITFCSKIILKNIFDTPHHGFPSGHMMGFTAFYGWVCFNLSQGVSKFLKAVIFIITCMILICAATWIVHMNFHIWGDIFGGVMFGGILLKTFIDEFK